MLTTTLDVVSVFEAFRPADSPISQWAAGGRETFAEKVDTFVARQLPIQFMMLGYPFKSTNHEHKTLGKLPDLAELSSFRNWRRFGQAVQQVYDPGIEVSLVSDGFAFNDLLGEADAVVDAYTCVAAEYAKGTPVKLISMQDFYPTTLDVARAKLEEHFGITELELEERILSDPDVTALYRGMIRFMEEELANRTFASNKRRHVAAKALARQMMLRNEAYSALAAQEFGNAIRLSMHRTTNLKKYAFQLIPGPECWASPWHCAVLLRSNGELTTVHKKDAEQAGWHVIEQEGRPFYYVQ